MKNNHPFKVGDIIRVKKCGLTYVPAAAMVTGEVQEAYKGSVLVRLDEVVRNAGGFASRTWYSSNPNEQLELFTPITEEARASAVTTKEGGEFITAVKEEPGPTIKAPHPFKVGDRVKVIGACGLERCVETVGKLGTVQSSGPFYVAVKTDEPIKGAWGWFSSLWVSSAPNEQLALITNTPRQPWAKEWMLQKRGLEELSKPSPTLPKLLLDEAKDILAERGGTYGAAEDSFASIAQAWNAYLDNKPKNSRIAPLDVAMMMTILKCIREAQNHKWDNLVDIAGYAQNAACIAKPSQREAMR